MIVELGVFALVSGLFSKLIYKHSWVAIPATLTAFIAGRATFLALVGIFQGVTNLSVGVVWNQILKGWPGLIIIAVVVPTFTILLNVLLKKEKKES